jgi:uncharacterized protein (TIGR00369 family)
METQAGGDDLAEDPREIRSPFGDYLGVAILERSTGLCRLSCPIAPHHLNRGGALHGGVILALMDHAGGLAGSWAGEDEPARFSVTIDLNGRFAKPAKSGQVLVEAKIVSEGKSIYFASTEIRDETGQLVAFGSSTHKRLRSDMADRTSQRGRA